VFSPPVNVGIFDAPVSVAHMHRSIGDPSTRPQWDSFCKFGRNVRSFNANCEQNEILFKPIWPVAGRDQQLISARRRLPGGARMYVATSLPPKFQPPKIPGYVRAKLITAGYYVMPRPGGCGDGVRRRERGRRSGDDHLHVSRELGVGADVDILVRLEEVRGRDAVVPEVRDQAVETRRARREHSNRRVD
jgi:hypothetical protein